MSRIQVSIKDGVSMGNHLSGQDVTNLLKRLTRSSGRRTATHPTCVEFCSCLALLPMGVTEQPHYCDPGGLLHHHFTLTFSGGMFLWPDPTGCPIPGVTRHRVLWSADFPRHGKTVPRSPGQPGHFHNNGWNGFSQWEEKPINPSHILLE